MKNGLYFAKFNSNMSDWGDGVITIQENKVNGGDFACFYQGEIKGSKIILHVTQHSTQRTSVFGDLKEFDLDLDIKEFSSNLEASGNVVGQPHLTIQIQLKFLSDLL
ncbi:GrlR family regulatory protein [Gilliamella sp. N-G2]|uniref:GrlR family regulatory protein n=1 Tax=Gilliamella sp. N-G2 TaxID=1970471 RepID=UPI001302B337|nr:GrlR family regulatory protein [Gilliamella sp. N-G2]